MSIRVFKDKNNLESLRKLRQKGYTYQSLAFIFNVDFSSIYHHVKDIKPETKLVLNLKNLLLPLTVDSIHIVEILHIKHPEYKTYNDYVRESKERLSQYQKIN